MTRKDPLVMVLEVLPLVYMHVDVLGGNKRFGFDFTLAVVARSIFLVMVTVMMKDWRLLLEKVLVVVRFLVWAPVSLNMKEVTR
jgi:hypothetical protein